MLIDLHRALYSHCDHPLGRAPHIDAVLDMLIEECVGAEVQPTRLATFLQGSTTDLPEDYELRLHVWFRLPQGHPRYAEADRGLACLVRPIDQHGLRGPCLGGAGWLARPLQGEPRAQQGDWIDAMVQAQGYQEIPGSEWLSPCSGPLAEQTLR